MPISQLYIKAQRTKKNYICADCKRSLYLLHDPDDRDNRIIACGNCGTKTPGFIYRKEWEKRMAESNFDEAEVKKNYPELFGDKKEKRSEKDIKGDLGF